MKASLLSEVQSLDESRDISKVTDVVETETGGEHVETEAGLKRFGVLG